MVAKGTVVLLEAEQDKCNKDNLTTGFKKESVAVERTGEEDDSLWI
jgi:hypothetical protein